MNRSDLSNRKIKQRVWIAVGLGLTLATLLGVWLEHQYDKYPRAYAQLKPGASKAEVLRNFGKPDEITECDQIPQWDGEPVDPKSARCVREFWYFSRLRIGEWIVGFDANDRVVTKDYGSSP